jgi:hypothetical protein
MTEHDATEPLAGPFMNVKVKRFGLNLTVGGGLPKRELRVAPSMPRIWSPWPFVFNITWIVRVS